MQYTVYRFLRLWYKYEVSQKVLSFCQIYFSRNESVLEYDRNVFFTRKVTMT